LEFHAISAAAGTGLAELLHAVEQRLAEPAPQESQESNDQVASALTTLGGGDRVKPALYRRDL
jgi:predicted GTPase